MKRPINRPEETIHRALAAFLDTALPSDSYWFSVPNQRGTRKRFEMGILQALGVKSGVPDIIILVRGQFIGLEVKAPKGTLNDNQKAASDRIFKSGGLYSVVRSPEEAERYLRSAGVQLRASILPREAA